MNKEGRLSRPWGQHGQGKAQRSEWHVWEMRDKCKRVRCMRRLETSQVGSNPIIKAYVPCLFF